MTDDNTGVINQPEGETGATTPGSEQTTQTAEAPVTEAKPEVSEEKFVPYSRFKESNEKAKQYEAKLQEVEARLSELDKRSAPAQAVDPQEQQVKQLLNQYGYLSRDEFQAELDKREQRLREDNQVNQELARLEQKYDGKNGLPKFDRRKVVEFALDRRLADPEVAYKTMFEKEYLNWHIQQASNKSKGVKTESSDGSGGQPAGATNSDLMSEAMKGDDQAFNTLIKRTNVFQNFFKK